MKNVRDHFNDLDKELAHDAVESRLEAREWRFEISKEGCYGHAERGLPLQ